MQVLASECVPWYSSWGESRWSSLVHSQSSIRTTPPVLLHLRIHPTSDTNPDASSVIRRLHQMEAFQGWEWCSGRALVRRLA